jgi:hypothetical protein
MEIRSNVFRFNQLAHNLLKAVLLVGFACKPERVELMTPFPTAGNGAGGTSSGAGATGTGKGGSAPAYSCLRSYDASKPEVGVDDAVSNNPSGSCHYTDVPYIVTGDTGSAPYINQNVWGTVPKTFKQQMYANSPRDWFVIVNKPNDTPTDTLANGAVGNYPNVGFWMRGNVDDYASITASWDVTLPHNNQSAGWAAFDLWFNDDGTDVLIQVDIGANQYFNCDVVATATFSEEPWHLCIVGDERVWKRGTDDEHIVNKSSGTLDIKQILTWMESHTFVDPSTHATRQQLPPSSKWQTSFVGASFGFEVPSTSGMDAEYRVNDFSWTATR